MVIIVDGNWLFNRAAFTAERPEYIAWSLVSMACADAVHAKAKKMLVAFDGPKVFRYDIWPLYKINRKGVKFTKEQMLEALSNSKKAKALASRATGHREIYQYLPLVQQYLTEIGVKWVQYPQYEADDVLRSAAHQLEGRVVLAAPDKDLYQSLVKDNVRILSTKYEGSKMKRQFVTREKVIKRFGIGPELMIDYQTLIGDSGDGILPVVGPKTAIKYLEQYGSLAKAIDAEERLRKEIKHLELNRKLVTLATDVLIPDDLSIAVGTKAKTPKSYKELVASLKATSLF